MTNSWAASQTDGDVFTKLHRAVVQALLECEKLTAVVRAGNMNLYADKMVGQPSRQSAAEADLPELHVYPSGLSLNGSPSDGNHYTQNYTIMHSTGDTRVDKGHGQIKAAVLYAINRMRHSQLGMENTVILIRCLSYSEQISEDGGRQRGWTGTATLEVRFKIADWEVAL